MVARGGRHVATELEGISGGGCYTHAAYGAGSGRTRVGTGARTALTRRVQAIPSVETECYSQPSLPDVAFQILAALDKNVRALFALLHVVG
jgi:hypothetical protein